MTIVCAKPQNGRLFDNDNPETIKDYRPMLKVLMLLTAVLAVTFTNG
jgi:hypothetical protein